MQPVKNLTIPGNGTFNGNVPVMDFAYLDGYIYYIRDQSIHRLDTTDGNDELFLTLDFNPNCTTIHAYQGKLLIYKLIRNVEVISVTTSNIYYNLVTSTIEIHTVDTSTKQVDFLNVVSTAGANHSFSVFFSLEPFNNSTCFIHNGDLYVVGQMFSAKSQGSDTTNIIEPDLPPMVIETYGQSVPSPFIAKIKLDQFSLFEVNLVSFGPNLTAPSPRVGYSTEVVSSDVGRPVDGIAALGLTKMSSYTHVDEMHSNGLRGEFAYGIRGGIPIVKSGDTIYLLPAFPNTANAEAQYREHMHNNTMFVCSVGDFDSFLSSKISVPTTDSFSTYSKPLNGNTYTLNLTDSKGISSPACIVDDNIYLFGGITYDDISIVMNNSAMRLGSSGLKNSIELVAKILIYNVTTGEITEMDLPYPNSKGGCPIVNGGYVYVPTDAGIGIYQLEEYNITYSIKGAHVDISLENKAPITYITFSSSLGYQYYNFETLTGTVKGSYEAKPPANATIIGYSLKPNAKTPDFILGETYEVSIDENTTFYEVYNIYRPPTTTFELELYQNTAERNRVDKTDYLSYQGSLKGALRAECSLTSPVITLELYDIPTFNYVYIDKFQRWYYVTDITSLRTNLWAISLAVDVLMTYKDGIKMCSAFIDRNENSFDPLIVDNKLPLKQGQTVTEYTLDNSVFTDGTTKAGQFLLTGILVSPGDEVTQALSVDTDAEEFEPLSTVEESEV